MSFKIKNQLKELLRAGKTAVGAQLRFGSPAIAELFGIAGFDWILLDSEHAPQSPITIQSQLQAVGTTTTTAIARLHKNDHDLIRLYLDMGAMGVLVPFINTPDQAKLGAQACRYPPQGIRGYGPHRADGYGFHSKEYFNQINDQVMFIPMIESAEAMENIDAIFAVDGVDACMFGPLDLSISLGVPFNFISSEFQNAEKKYLDAAHRAGKPAGVAIYTNVFDQAAIGRQMELGAQLILVGGDQWIMTDGCKRIINIFSELKK